MSRFAGHLIQNTKVATEAKLRFADRKIRGAEVWESLNADRENARLMEVSYSR